MNRVAATRIAGNISWFALIAGGFLLLAGHIAPLVLAAQSEQSPALPEARQLEQRADILMARKEFRLATETYLKALKLEPRNPVLLNKIGISYHQVSNLRMAKRYYERATKADPNYAEAWNNRGTVDYHHKKYKKAAKHYQKAIALNPNLASCHSNLGSALFAMKKYDDAFAEFRTAFQLDPEVFERRSFVGVLLHERSVENPGQYYFMLAKLFASSGDVERCVAYLKKAREGGYQKWAEIQQDPAFQPVLADPRVQEVVNPPAPAAAPPTP
jgi:tetratricopeptide (TPR) repeat protein